MSIANVELATTAMAAFGNKETDHDRGRERPAHSPRLRCRQTAMTPATLREGLLIAANCTVSMAVESPCVPTWFPASFNRDNFERTKLRAHAKAVPE
jgi:hypothetical protein